MVYPPIRPSIRAPSLSAASSVSEDSSIAPSKPVKRPRRPAGRGGVGRRSERQHRRSRSGCFTCRLRRKKCDEGKPSCTGCKNLKLDCEYTRPIWWGDSDERKGRKSDMKDYIKTTKTKERKEAAVARSQTQTLRPPSLCHSVTTPDAFGDCPSQTREGSAEPKFLPVEGDFNEVYTDPFDPFRSQLGTPGFDATPFWTSGAPYEVDIKTERELFVNDVPMRRDSSISTYTTFKPPPNATLPTFSGEDWISQEVFESHNEGFAMPEMHTFSPYEFRPAAAQVPYADVDESDKPLLDHFFHHVLPLIFPILEARQHGTFGSDVVIPALESNKCYRHCCLGIAALHMKITRAECQEDLDSAIVKHRYQTVSEVCEGLKNTSAHDAPSLAKFLEASLAMIFFQNAVGSPHDSMPDIPWYTHFDLAKDLVLRLDLPNRPPVTSQSNSHLPPFSMTLAAWVDILGSTMLGQMPQFAHTFRHKFEQGSGSGLRELMGCEDRVMYLISEIACLDHLKLRGLEHHDLCGLVSNLGEQLDQTEAPAQSLRKLTSVSGEADSRQLVTNITALFRVAARIYLASLIPESHQRHPDLLKLTAWAADILDLIPSGPEGFDRSIVWPVLICGAFSTPEGPFRQALWTRINLLGDQASFGNFGRMVQVLQEVWRIADADISSTVDATSITSAPQAINMAVAGFLPTPEASTTASPDAISMMASQEQHQQHQRQQQHRSIHWRDVMKQHGWEYLLI